MITPAKNALTHDGECTGECTWKKIQNHKDMSCNISNEAMGRHPSITLG